MMERQEERERKLQARRAFIIDLSKNQPHVIGENTWYLHDAISNITNKEFWDFRPMMISGTTLEDLFDLDPESVCDLYVMGRLDKFKSMIQHEIEKLSDLVRF